MSLARDVPRNSDNINARDSRSCTCVRLRTRASHSQSAWKGGSGTETARLGAEALLGTPSDCAVRPPRFGVLCRRKFWASQASWAQENTHSIQENRSDQNEAKRCALTACMDTSCHPWSCPWTLDPSRGRRNLPKKPACGCCKTSGMPSLFKSFPATVRHVLHGSWSSVRWSGRADRWGCVLNSSGMADLGLLQNVRESKRLVFVKLVERDQDSHQQVAAT